MTGGPDGDVGGNLIKILNRDYGMNPKIVGIADGSGCGEDPDGLDINDRSSFDSSKEAPIADVRSSASSDRRDASRRSTIPMACTSATRCTSASRRTPSCRAADAPPRSTPRTGKDFLNADGTPSSSRHRRGRQPLPHSPTRAQKLSDCGVLIMKDSSANKCGVITSSYEISSNMLISEEEFLAIKEPFVEQVKEKLRLPSPAARPNCSSA